MEQQKRTTKDFEEYIDMLEKMVAEEGFEGLDETFVKHLECRYFGQEVVIGESARISLREMKMSDLEAFYAFEDAFSEPILGAFLKKTKAESEAHLQAYMEHMYPLYDYGMWSVVEKETEAIIGICGLGHNDCLEAECTDLGYYICPKWRKKGIATECIEIVLDYAENYLELPRVYAMAEEKNTVSQNILCKFGFEFLKKLESTDGSIAVYQKELAKDKV